MESPDLKQEEDIFTNLPLDLQRTMIEWCVANKQDTMDVEGKVYTLPHIIQFTYRCTNQKCNEVIQKRFFKDTVLTGYISDTSYCVKCKSKMYTAHKTATIDYHLGVKEKEKLKGLMKFLAPMLVDEQDTYGPPPSVEE